MYVHVLPMHGGALVCPRPHRVPVVTRCVPLLNAGDGKCAVCDSYVKPHTLVRICDECNYGSYEGRCVICGGLGISDAHYCKECTIQEKDVRDYLRVFAARCCYQVG